MAGGISEDAIESGTGRSWESWLAYFESVGAQDLNHKQIVAKAIDAGASHWWCQMVTVAYEQHIGRREPGQRGDGAFNLSVGKTRAGTKDDSIVRWQEIIGEMTDFSGVEITRGPEVTSSEKWRYWRCGLGDGSRIVVYFSDKAPEKSVVSVHHEMLDSKELAEAWRNYWKTMLAKM